MSRGRIPPGSATAWESVSQETVKDQGGGLALGSGRWALGAWRLALGAWRWALGAGCLALGAGHWVLGAGCLALRRDRPRSTHRPLKQRTGSRRVFVVLRQHQLRGGDLFIEELPQLFVRHPVDSLRRCIVGETQPPGVVRPVARKAGVHATGQFQLSPVGQFVDLRSSVHEDFPLFEGNLLQRRGCAHIQAGFARSTGGLLRYGRNQLTVIGLPPRKGRGGDRPLQLGSIIITSNRDIQEWHSLFGDPLLASSAMDRLLHHSHVITLEGHSFRNPPSERPSQSDP